jgi:hypothetical protein
MPRAKSELTNDNVHVGARLTKAHWQEWKRLGGAQWLRKVLAKSLQEKNNARKG